MVELLIWLYDNILELKCFLLYADISLWCILRRNIVLQMGRISYFSKFKTTENIWRFDCQNNIPKFNYIYSIS